MSDPVTSPSSSAEPPPGTAALSLMGLLVDQRQRWQGGEPMMVEAYLERHPVLAADGDAVLDLIGNELLLRREQGQAPLLAEYLQRFPRLASPLKIQFEVEGALPTHYDTLVQGEAMPAQVGRYQLLGPLGAGGMGMVYRARDLQLRRDVAIKMPTFGGSVEARAVARQRFLREARAAAAVHHANVCPIHDVGEEHGRPFVVMALIVGESLAERLRRQRRFDEVHEAVALVALVAEALAAVQAGQHFARPRRPTFPDRLRPGPCRRQRTVDVGRVRDGNTRLHGAGASVVRSRSGRRLVRSV